MKMRKTRSNGSLRNAKKDQKDAITLINERYTSHKVDELRVTVKELRVLSRIKLMNGNENQTRNL